MLEAGLWRLMDVMMGKEGKGVGLGIREVTG